MYIYIIIKTNDMNAIKKENKNGTFRFELENGEVIIKSTKRNYNAFALTYLNEKLFNAGATTKGGLVALGLAEGHGWKKEQIFISEVI